MPSKDKKKLMKYLESEYNITCDYRHCKFDDFEKVPDLVFSIGGKIYKIPRESYMIRKYKDPNSGYLRIMSPKSTFNHFWILGLNFFDNYYVVFDQEKSRVGFALSKNSAQRL